MLPSMSAPVERSQARPWVAEDLDKIPDDGYRREVIGGMLFVSPSPIGRHQLATGKEALEVDFPYPFQVVPADLVEF